MQRLAVNLQLALVIALLSVNNGATLLSTVALAAAEHAKPTAFGGIGLIALFAFHFLVGCALFARFLELTERPEYVRA
jgi:hypothetical protein